MLTSTRTRSASPASSRRDGAGNFYSSPYTRRDPSFSMFRDPNLIKSEFTTCSENGCLNTSRVAHFTTMTLRTGLSYCTEHVKMNEVTKKIQDLPKLNDITLIFYDIELSRDGEIEQIGACTMSGESFVMVVRTPVRTSTSPIIKSYPPHLWNMIATEPKEALTDFISWTKEMHYTNTNGNTDMSKIMLAAHFGSCHDHMHMLRTMMKWGITPPPYRLSDTLAIFKTMKGMNENAKLANLVNQHAAWINHTPHDASSDADALRFVTMFAFPNTKAACYAFSISCLDFNMRTGLNRYVPSPIATFSYTPTSIYDSMPTYRRPSSVTSLGSNGTHSSI
ncbi:hypothetical protein KC359_g8911 [Hortaea werneckii]|nr:hypothetical protein KC359_g8911 [Hortaea werneckii]